MTPLRRRMLEDMRLHNLSRNTQKRYLDRVAAFAKHFGKSPDLLGPEEVRRYQLYLLEERLNPFLSQAYMRMGSLYITKEDHATAVIALKLALDADERNLRARLDLALLMERKGDTESAIEEWQRFIKDVDGTSRDDRALYGITEADAANARRRLEKLFLSKAGTDTGEEKE